MMDPLFGKIAVVAGLLAYILIRRPHGMRRRMVSIREDRKGALEIGLLIGAWLGTTIMPLVWVATGLFSFAQYRLHPACFAAGVILMLGGLWLFYRSHKDLGLHWSVTLQMRDDHELVTTGIDSRIRHPMYAAMFVLGIAQLIYVPNWLVGPSYLVAFGLLYACRVGREERMMLDRFGSAYEAYQARTGRLLPRFG